MTCDNRADARERCRDESEFQFAEGPGGGRRKRKTEAELGVPVFTAVGQVGVRRGPVCRGDATDLESSAYTPKSTAHELVKTEKESAQRVANAETAKRRLVSARLRATVGHPELQPSLHESPSSSSSQSSSIQPLTAPTPPTSSSSSSSIQSSSGTAWTLPRS